MRTLKTCLVIMLMISTMGCAPLQVNRQHSNATGLVQDNRWDYYNGLPVHYTSFSYGKYKNTMIVRQEKTDGFSGVFNLDKNKDEAVVELNDKVLTLKKFNNDARINSLIERTFGSLADKSIYKKWDEWYESEDGKLLIAVSYKRQMVVTSFEDGDAFQQIAYYPSRYSACVKIAQIKAESDAKVIGELLKTALVAGVQSYTSYSTSNVYTNYGNFGYAVTRDYSWAGARAGDALDTLFSGQYSVAKVTQAWNSLNCF